MMVTGAVFSVVVTVTVTVTVAWPFPAATFSLTGTPVGADAMLAPSAPFIRVLETVNSMGCSLSGLAFGGTAEDSMTAIDLSGEGCELCNVGNEACALFSLGEARSFAADVTTANNAFGTETTSAVFDDADGEGSDFGELFKGLRSLACWTVAVVDSTEGVGACD